MRPGTWVAAGGIVLAVVALVLACVGYFTGTGEALWRWVLGFAVTAVVLAGSGLIVDRWDRAAERERQRDDR